MSFNMTWSRRWRRRGATSRRWRLHDRMRVHASRECTETMSRRVRATQDKVFSDVVEKLHKHVHPKTKKPASLIADDVYEVIMSNKDKINGAISASRGAAAPSRRRRDSCPSHDDVGGFLFDFEAVRTVSSEYDAPRMTWSP